MREVTTQGAEGRKGARGRDPSQKPRKKSLLGGQSPKPELPGGSTDRPDPPLYKEAPPPGISCPPPALH